MRVRPNAVMSFVTAWSVVIGGAMAQPPSRTPPKQKSKVMLQAAPPIGSSAAMMAKVREAALAARAGRPKVSIPLIPAAVASSAAAPDSVAVAAVVAAPASAPAPAPAPAQAQAAVPISIGLPKVITRHNLFVSDTMQQWFATKGIGMQMTEFGPHTPPSAEQSGSSMSGWGDFARLKAGDALSGSDLEQFKVNFLGWNLSEFATKASEAQSDWRRNPNYNLVKDFFLKDWSSWQTLQQSPSQFKGLINVDYESWSSDWMRAWMPTLSPGDQRCYKVMCDAMQTLRVKYPNAKITYYGFPYTWPFNVEGSPGQLRQMMSDTENPVLFGDPNVPMPLGRKNAIKWKNSFDLMKMVKERTTSAPEYVDFAGKYLDVLSPTCYPYGSSTGEPTWDALEHVAADDSNSASAAVALLAKTPPQDSNLAAWRKNVYVGDYDTREGVTSFWYVDKQRPDLGAHTSNYWQMFRTVVLAKGLAANVASKFGRDLPVYPCLSWHNPLGFHSTPIRPLNVAEFEEGVVKAVKEGGADGVYVWEPLVNDMLLVLEQSNKDVGAGGQEVSRSRQVIRLQLDTLDLNKKSDGSPLLPPSNSVFADPIWKDKGFLLQVQAQVDKARMMYYDVVLKYFPAQ